MLRAIKTVKGDHVVINVNNIVKIEPASESKQWNIIMLGSDKPVGIHIDDLCSFVDKLRNTNPYDVYTYDVLKGYKNK